jgi:hypothetical protein
MVNGECFLLNPCFFFGMREISAGGDWRWYDAGTMNEPHRRLSDKILAAFDQACERQELDVAELLVRALELTLTRTGGKGNVDQRTVLGPVIEAYERLKALRGGATP